MIDYWENRKAQATGSLILAAIFLGGYAWLGWSILANIATASLIIWTVLYWPARHGLDQARQYRHTLRELHQTRLELLRRIGRDL